MWLFCPFFASATVFHLTGLEQIYALSPDRVLDNIMYIHFADNWNDFGGFMYFANNLWDEEDVESGEIFEVATNSEKSLYECRSQVKWFYYYGARWERLWPLDAETWRLLTGMQWLNMTWWIYTLCAQKGYQEALEKCERGEYCGTTCDYNECVAKVRNDFSAGGYGYYGSLEQEYSWENYKLVMGVDYDTETEEFISIESESDLEPTFVRLNNKFPVWFIYDNVWGLGLAWCMFDPDYLTGGSMKNLVREVKENWLARVFHAAGTKYIQYRWSLSWITCTGISFQDRLTKILIEWIMWLGNSGTGWDTKFWTMGNSSDTKMQYFATKSVSNVTMMNYARRRAELLCRWKWVGALPNINASGEKIICLDNVSVDSDTANKAKLFGKTLIVKNGDVIVSPMKNMDLIDKYYDIFILNGNLLIDEEGAEKFVINNKGFVTGMSIVDFRKSVIQWEVWRQYKMAELEDLTYVINSYIKCLGDCSEETTDDDCSEDNPDECCTQGNPNECKFWMDYNGDWFITEDDKILLVNYLTWVILDEETPNYGNDVVAVASVLRWNFIVNWNVLSASGNVLNNKYFLYGKFTTKDTISSLENVFAWRCDNEAGSDGNFCPKFDNPYRNASLVVIDQNYSSPLLQS